MSTNPSTSTHSPLFDERRWVIQIRHTLDEELEEDDDIQVSISNVPKPLLQSKPEVFVPQLIALGPYHPWQPELYEMQKYKLSAAKRVQKQLPSVKFQQLVDSIAKHESRIRGNYHRYLDVKGETLAWMMAVDTCFLLEFLHVYAVAEEGRVMKRISSKMSNLVDDAGKKSGHNAILRDIMMLENQELCPFKLMENFPAIDASQHAHLLELLYSTLMPKSEGQGDANEIEEELDEPTVADTETRGLRGKPDHVKQLCGNIWNIALGSDGAPVQLLKVLFCRPVRLLVRVPWKLMTTIPGFSSHIVEDQSSELDRESAGHENKPPRVEEIMIPSVEELVDSGVRFCPTNGDLTSIAFDAKTAIFSLPTVSLDVNSEVILRNLVAYEASVAPGPLVFTRYTELMNGIIDAEEDVKLLRDSKIVLNHMKSDTDVAELWNGMSRSVRLTRVAFMDKVIEDVNKYHNSRWRVKTKKFMAKYVFGSWPFLTFLASILLLLLTGVQAFCSVYNCARWFNISTAAVQQP